MIERRQLPGVVRVRRRVLLRADVLLDWLDQPLALQKFGDLVEMGRVSEEKINGSDN